MECSAVRENLSALIDGELPAGRIEKIRDHVSSCQECRMVLKELENTDSWLRMSGSEADCVDVPQSFVSEMNRCIQPAEIRPEGDILTVQDLSRYLKVPIGTVWKLLPDIPCIRIGDHIRFRKESIDAWLSRRENRGSNRSTESVRLTVVKS